MQRKWVVNASPLILLVKTGFERLLWELSSELVIPRGVATEIAQGPPDDPARRWLDGTGMAFIRDDFPAPADIVAWDLGAGETAVLAWAVRDRGFEAVLDDRDARNCAIVHGVRVRGTLGVVMLARQEGLLPSARAACESLMEAGLYLDRSFMNNALALVGE